jgi:hypothetical protein
MDYLFSQYRVDISTKVKHKISVSTHTAAASLNPLIIPTKVAYPLSIAPLQTLSYFQAREGFNLMSLLKQPMALMMLFTVAMVVIMPRMMNNMDDKEKEEMLKMQSSMSLTGIMKNMEKKVKGAQQQQQQQIS